MLNPWKPGSSNYYHYEYMKAQDILWASDAPTAEQINDPKAYEQLRKEAQRLEKGLVNENSL